MMEAVVLLKVQPNEMIEYCVDLVKKKVLQPETAIERARGGPSGRDLEDCKNS